MTDEPNRKPPAKRSTAGDAAKKGIQSKILEFKKAEILTAAARLFFLQGYSATTVDGIAAELGVTKPFIYTHFDSKQDILNHLFVRTMDETLTAFKDFDPKAQSFPVGLHDLVRRFVLVVISVREGVGFFWRGEKDLPPLDRKRARIFKSTFEKPFLTVMTLGSESGVFRDVDAELGMKCIEGMINWIYVWYRPDGRLSAKHIADKIAEFVVQMVKI